MRKTRTTIAVATVAAALAAITAGPASAATTGQLVTGTTLSTLALAATPVVMDTTFQPGQTASNSVPGQVIVSSTGAWNLTAHDAVNGGHLASAGDATFCNPAGGPNSEATTVHQLDVAVSGTLGGTTGSSGVQIGALPAAVASGTLADTLSTSFSLVLDSTEALLTGCVYSTTVTYTAS
jgi:hypothetical protein